MNLGSSHYMGDKYKQESANLLQQSLYKLLSGILKHITRDRITRTDPDSDLQYLHTALALLLGLSIQSI